MTHSHNIFNFNLANWHNKKLSDKINNVKSKYIICNSYGDYEGNPIYNIVKDI